MASKKHKKKPIGKREFLFNVISLVVVICIGIYFGARSFYYYGKQNMKIKEEAMTLNGLILVNNKVTKDGDGLHQDTDGYYFKGNVLNNYVVFANRTFRVVKVNNDNTVQLVSNDIVGEFLWGEDAEYHSSNLYSWLTITKEQNSGIYYTTIPNPKKFLVQTSYREDTLLDSKVSSSKKQYRDYVTTLTIQDYSKANGKNSYLNINKFYWVLGLDKDGSNLYVDNEGSIQSSTGYEGYGVRAVITLKANTSILSGDGTISNPYVIDQGKYTNYVDSYVKIGNDTYKVFEDKDEILRLGAVNYIMRDGTFYVGPYSNSTSLFDPTNRKNIGYFLNRTYYYGLSYASFLLDSNFYTGEISNETGLSYQNIYQNVTTSKVGLFNMFDYNNIGLDNYYLLNTTSTVGSMGYIYHSNGLLEEAKVTDSRYFVPVVSINKNLVKSGTGSISDPFVVG